MHHLRRERLKPPQRQRKASQTTRGFTCLNCALVHSPERGTSCRRRPTSRSHSRDFNRRGRRPATAPGAGLRTRGRPPRERLKPPQRLRKASQTARGFTCLNGDCHVRPESRSRAWHSPATDQSAQADFAIFQRRIHSLLATRPSPRCTPFVSGRVDFAPVHSPERGTSCRRRPTSRSHSRDFNRRGRRLACPQDSRLRPSYANHGRHHTNRSSG